MAGPSKRAGERTRSVHGPSPAMGPLSTPLVFSATFAFPSLEAMNAEQQKGPDSAYYQRVGNPTVAACERRLADLEGAERSLLFSSGVAATAAIFLSYLASGDRVAAMRECYGGTLQQLEYGREHFGWRLTLLSAGDPGGWERAIEPGTKIVHVESPTNPVLRVIDLRRAAALAHARGALLTVDGTFGPPVVQKPLALGADLVMHSATKYLGGHSDLLAGVVSGSQPLMEPLAKARRTFGAMLDPMSAWHLERGLKTLPLRMDAIHRNAMSLAQRLEAHPAIERVSYPGLASHPQHALAREQMQGFGGVVAVVVRGGGDGARTFIEALRVFSHAPSLGGVESLASLPAYTSHVYMTASERAAAGIDDGMVRLAVGVEDEADLWADLEHALSKVRVGVA